MKSCCNVPFANGMAYHFIGIICSWIRQDKCSEGYNLKEKKTYNLLVLINKSTAITKQKTIQKTQKYKNTTE